MGLPRTYTEAAALPFLPAKLETKVIPLVLPRPPAACARSLALKSPSTRPSASVRSLERRVGGRAGGRGRSVGRTEERPETRQRELRRVRTIRNAGELDRSQRGSRLWL